MDIDVKEFLIKAIAEWKLIHKDLQKTMPPVTKVTFVKGLKESISAVSTILKNEGETEVAEILVRYEKEVAKYIAIPALLTPKTIKQLDKILDEVEL